MIDWRLTIPDTKRIAENDAYLEQMLQHSKRARDQLLEVVANKQEELTGIRPTIVRSDETQL